MADVDRPLRVGQVLVAQLPEHGRALLFQHVSVERLAHLAPIVARTAAVPEGRPIVVSVRCQLSRAGMSVAPGPGQAVGRGGTSAIGRGTARWVYFGLIRPQG